MIPFILFFLKYPLVNNVSNSLSYNSKIQFFKKDFKSKKVKILIMGSSFSLNNLHPNPLLDFYNTNEYINLSSWGQNMEIIYTNLRYFNKKFNIEHLIINSGVPDFLNSRQNINFNKVEKYLSGEITFPSLRRQDLKNYIDHVKYKNNQFNYNSLIFDEYGTVILPKNGFEIDLRRWNGAYGDTFKEKLEDINDNQLIYLDSIAIFCNSNNIQFIYVNNPYRDSFLYLQDTSAIVNYNIFQLTIDSILQYHNAENIKTNNESWPDSLFNDISHMNIYGAIKLSNHIVNHLETEK